MGTDAYFNIGKFDDSEFDTVSTIPTIIFPTSITITNAQDYSTTVSKNQEHSCTVTVSQ